MAAFCRYWPEFDPLPVVFVGFSTAVFSWGFFGVAFEHDFTTMRTVYQKVTAIGLAFVQKHLGHEDIGAVRNRSRSDAAWQDLLAARVLGCPADTCRNDEYCCDN